MTKRNGNLRVNQSVRRRQIYLIFIPLFVLLIKFVIMANIKAGAWLGADGENYLKGVEGLQISGFFSDEPKLSFWPAGYPLLMWPFAEITTFYFFYVISFIQSLFFAFATYFFAKEVSKSDLKNLAVSAAIFVSFNPTLSLGTLCIGYESPIAACFLMVIGLSIRFISLPPDQPSKAIRIAAQISGWFALMIFMQPRFILVAFIFILILAFGTIEVKQRLRILSLGIIIVLVAPTIMIIRNYEASGKATISNNLGVTMAIGAGPETRGGYVHSGPEVQCVSGALDKSVNDESKAICVAEWYAKHPLQTLRLAFNKSLFFWSPWSGPLAEGTMARNPWLNISPAYSVMKNPDGANLVLGKFGKTISYMWIFGQMFFLLIGFLLMSKRGGLARKFANLAIVPVLISWAICIGTIGDHRFRIPTMSLSLILQAVAFREVKNKITKVV